MASSSPSKLVSPPSRALQMRTRTWCALVAARLWMSLVVMQTFDAPDEWWQSVEVAYWYVFGRGELTWEWRTGIRSFVYPAPFALVFWLLKTLGLDSAWAVYAAPKVMSGLVCAGIDWCTHRVALKYLSPSIAVSRVALFLSVTSWYTTFIGLRTLSNAVEAWMVLLVLLPTSFDGFLFFAGLGCALRPTFALPMLPLALIRLQFRPFKPNWSVGKLVVRCIAWTLAWLTVIAIIDRTFYGRWLCTPLNFMRFNLVEGLSALFGTHPWHWYIPLIPVALGPSLILVPFITSSALDMSPSKPPLHRTFTVAVAVLTMTIFVSYSMLPHKEMRFIAPAVPLMHLLAASGWVNSPTAWKWRRAIGVTISVVGMGLTFFTIGLWQRGPIAAMNYLRVSPPPMGSSGPSSVHVMANCHSTPGYSYLHGVVDDLVLNNCSVELTEPMAAFGHGRKRLPMEHHFFVHHPLHFVNWIYDGIAPAMSNDDDDDADDEREQPVAARGNYRVHEPSLHDSGLADVDLVEALVERVRPRSRDLPERFVVFDVDVPKLLPFLVRHGYAVERRFTHCPAVPVLLPNASFVEVWQRR